MSNITNKIIKSTISHKKSISYINQRILNEFCEDTITKLTDKQLLDEYKKMIF